MTIEMQYENEMNVSANIINKNQLKRSQWQFQNKLKIFIFVTQAEINCCQKRMVKIRFEKWCFFWGGGGGIELKLCPGDFRL